MTREIANPNYDPQLALEECLDEWNSGVWDDTNAVWNLEEVMEHLNNILG